MNVLITGAGKGIGLELVQEFYGRKEVQHIIAVSRNTDKLTKRYGADTRLIIISADLATKAGMELLSNTVKTRVSQIDILINNAGLLINKPFLQVTAKEAEDQFRVNYHVPAEIVRNFLPELKASGSAHVVNISSMGGFQGSVKFKGLAHYSSSKAALSCLSECLALELEDYGISVNALCLGAAQTEMLEEAFPGYKAPVTAAGMAGFIYNFALWGRGLVNGKVIPVASSNP